MFIKLLRVGVLFLFLSLFNFLISSSAWAKTIVPIFQYHYIGPVPNPKDILRWRLSVSPENFDKQMLFLRDSGFEPITLDYLPYALAGRLGPNGGKPVLLSFDDGYMDFYFNAFPILRKYNFHAVEFIPTGRVGGSYYMTWDQIKVIEQSGLVSFGAHSINHVDLTKLSLLNLDVELSESKRVLETETGHPVFYLAYPYGLYNALVLREAKRLGYVGGFAEGTGPTSSLSMSMTRIRLGNSVSFSQFRAWLIGKR